MSLGEAASASDIPEDITGTVDELVIHRGTATPTSTLYPLLKDRTGSAESNGADLFIDAGEDPRSTQPSSPPSTEANRFETLQSSGQSTAQTVVVPVGGYATRAVTIDIGTGEPSGEPAEQEAEPMASAEEANHVPKPSTAPSQENLAEEPSVEPLSLQKRKLNQELVRRKAIMKPHRKTWLKSHTSSLGSLPN